MPHAYAEVLLRLFRLHAHVGKHMASAELRTIGFVGGAGAWRSSCSPCAKRHLPSTGSVCLLYSSCGQDPCLSPYWQAPEPWA